MTPGYASRLLARSQGAMPIRWDELMSEDPSKTSSAAGGDPQMQHAYEVARATFRYFWREIAGDRRRIVPALEMSCVKAPFSDRPGAPSPNAVDTEHMWIGDVDFDGQFIHGELLNEPRWVKSVSTGDAVNLPLEQISDWIYAIDRCAYGGYTINVLRARMSDAERREHDNAWGLDFGGSGVIRTTSEEAHRALATAVTRSLRDHLAANPSAVHARGHNGWTLLHQEAAAGNSLAVSALLELGADPLAAADNGMTPIRLAEVLGWTDVVSLLAPRSG